MNEQTVEDIIRPEARILEKGRKTIEKKLSTLETLEVVYVSPDSVHPNPYNPNRQNEREFTMLKMSMQDDGFTQPIIVHQQTQTIVDGEHRWRAAKSLGYTEIPVVFVDMTDAQMRISTLRHNRARGSEDIELTIGVLRDLRALGGLEKAIEGLQINDTELNALLDGVSTTEIMAADEFSEAWVPQMTAEDPETMGKDRRISVTASAVEKIKEWEKKIDDLPTEDERADARQIMARDVYKITASWTPQDSKIIRSVLGDYPARRLCELCAIKILRNAEEYPESTLQAAKKVAEAYELI